MSSHRLLTSRKTSREIILLVIILANVAVEGKTDKLVDYCDTNLLTNAAVTSHLQFKKEFVQKEYAIAGTFKSLHCCAKGYRSIEWFKDGKSFPWAKEISSMILNPGALNQSIYSIQISENDAGRYTCVVKNDTHRIENSIQLEVTNTSPDLPLETFWPKTQYADIDGSARFFCEAFIGKKDLPDIPVTIKWFFQSGDNQDVPVDETLQETVTRGEEQIIGSYLRISNVTSSDFGTYTCRVQIGNSAAYALNMSVNLINALPINIENIWLEPSLLALITAVIVAILLMIFLYHSRNLWRRLFNIPTDDAEILSMKCKSEQSPSFVPMKRQKSSRRNNESTDDTVIMINTTYMN